MKNEKIHDKFRGDRANFIGVNSIGFDLFDSTFES